MVAISAADQEPARIGRECRGHGHQHRNRKAELVLCRQRPGSEQHRSRRQRNTELFDQNPGEEQQVTVHDQNVSGQSHRGISVRVARCSEPPGATGEEERERF